MKNTRSPSGKPWLFKGLIILFLLLPVQVSADGPVDLTLGMTGAFPWYESGIMPGSSNATSIELHNNGTAGGTLYIWLDNISEVNPHGSGTALGNYIYLNESETESRLILIVAHECRHLFDWKAGLRPYTPEGRQEMENRADEFGRKIAHELE